MDKKSLDDKYKRLSLQFPLQQFLESVKIKQEATVGCAFYQTSLYNKLHLLVVFAMARITITTADAYD